MKRIITKLIVLAATFFVTVLITGHIINKESIDLTSEMGVATLPILYELDGSTKQNIMYGYKSEIDACTTRDSICVIDKDMTLDFRLDTYGMSIDKISYELRSLDTERLVENGDAIITDTTDDAVTFDVSFGNLITEDEEYIFIITAQNGEDDINYYTRVALDDGYHARECRDFAFDFHNKTLDENNLSSLTSYIEPNDTADNSSLNLVTIHSSLSQIGWGDFKGTPLFDPIATITEITPYYNTLRLDYVMTSTSTEGAIEYYNIEESFRLRYSTDRIYLLDYNRKMDKILKAENDAVGSDYIQLGIRNSDVEFKSNETGTSMLWVQEGELFAYNTETNVISSVFAYRGNEGIDLRENHKAHDIKLINVDESGSCDFIVYGYLNRGTHEGRTGICVYHYDSSSNYIEEELFIPSNQSFEVLKEDLGELLYINTSSKFFIIVDKTLYKVDLSDIELETVASNLEDGFYCVSQTGAHVAYMNPKDTSKITAIDLDTEKTEEITADKGKCLKPLDYMGEDLVYGIGKETGITTDQTGNMLIPMDKLIIHSASGEDLKEYDKSGYQIMDANCSENTIYISLAKRSDSNHTVSLEDTIVNNEAVTNTSVYLNSTVTDGYERQYQLKIEAELSEAVPKTATPDLIVYDDNPEVKIDREDDSTTHYAYSYGHVITASNNLATAISAADECGGVVVDKELNYCWKRARNSAVSPLINSLTNVENASGSLARCIASMLELNGTNINVDTLISQGKTADDILTSVLKDKEILDLSGCSLEQTLYYISEGSPVLAITGNKSSVLIVGYSQTDVYVYEPDSNAVNRYKLAEYSDKLAKHGNTFISYK